jgi:hypothetical protein
MLEAIVQLAGASMDLYSSGRADEKLLLRYDALMVIQTTNEYNLRQAVEM